MKKSVKVLMLTIIMGLFISTDFVASQQVTTTNDQIETVRKLPVIISCFGCGEGTGMMVAHNPLDRNLAFYAANAFEIRWYTSNGKLYLTGTHVVDYICGNEFTVEIVHKKSGDRGVATFSEDCRIPLENSSVTDPVNERYAPAIY